MVHKATVINDNLIEIAQHRRNFNLLRCERLRAAYRRIKHIKKEDLKW